MNARRFETLTRTLAFRQSRRSALRQSLATAAVGLLAATGLRASPALAQAACTGHGCVCVDGPQAACDPGLLCCGTTGIPNGPGICMTEAECHPVCIGEGCYCNVADPAACDPGLVCCAVQSGYICASVAECGGLVPCTGLGCGCAVQDGGCDEGLICCGPNEAGARGTCQFPGDCFAEPLCDGPGCPCDVGNPDHCAPALFCCGGACTTDPACGAGPPCTGEGCLCDINDPGSCAPGLVCCLPSSQGDFVCLAACD